MILIINKDILVFCYCQKLLSTIQLLKEQPWKIQFAYSLFKARSNETPNGCKHITNVI